MPSNDKANLDRLLDADAPPPVIRRGVGVQLSTVPVPPPAPVPSRPAPPPPAAVALPQPDEPPPPAKLAASGPRRVNRGYQIREDYVKALKRIALDDDRKLFEVMEEAFAEYLERRRAR